MKPHFLLFYLFAALLLISGCAGKPVDKWNNTIDAEYKVVDKQAKWEWQRSNSQWLYQSVEWTPPHLAAGSALYESKSIVISIKADPKLNAQFGEAHTLMLKFIQMSSPTELDNYQFSSFRLADLMAADSKQLAADFLRENSIILSPSETKVLVLDRVKGAAYLTILAGYFQMTEDASVRLLPIPAITGRTIPYENKQRWWWPFAWRPFKGPVVSPAGEAARLNIWLELGEERINSLRARAF